MIDAVDCDGPRTLGEMTIGGATPPKGVAVKVSVGVEDCWARAVSVAAAVSKAVGEEVGLSVGVGVGWQQVALGNGVKVPVAVVEGVLVAVPPPGITVAVGVSVAVRVLVTVKVAVRV